MGDVEIVCQRLIMIYLISILSLGLDFLRRFYNQVVELVGKLNTASAVRARIARRVWTVQIS